MRSVKTSFVLRLAGLTAVLTLVGCGASTTNSSAFSVEGSVTGLSGTLKLQLNGGDDLTQTADGAFGFSATIPDRTNYAVVVSSQPSGQTCSVANGSGQINAANVTDVAVTCAAGSGSSTSYAVGGSVSGLTGTVILQNKNGETLTVTGTGSSVPFTFGTKVAQGDAFDVTVKTQPHLLTCTLANASGTISGADVTNVAVTCAKNVYTVAGTVTGLSGTLVLQDNGGNNLSLTAAGAFKFSAALADASAYSVTVLTQPTGQICSATANSGTINRANVTNVAVSCVSSYPISVVLTNLPGSTTLVLQNNGGDNLTLTANGTFPFPVQIADGATYHVKPLTQPIGSQCVVVANRSGTVSAATSVSVNCTTAGGKLVYVTDLSTQYDGNLGGISGADAKCNTDINFPEVGTYKAMIADGTSRVACTTALCGGGPSEHTDWPILATQQYVLADAATVVGTTNANGLFTFPLTNALTVASLNDYTGLNTNWTGNADTCSAWTSNSSFGNGSYGDTSLATSTVLRSSSTSCNNVLSLVCIEQ